MLEFQKNRYYEELGLSQEEVTVEKIRGIFEKVTGRKKELNDF